MIKKRKREWSDKNYFHIGVDIFKVDIVFVCNCNENETKIALKKACGKNYNDFNERELDEWDKITTLGRMIQFKGGFIVLAKNKDDNFRSFIGILVHEISHVVHYLLRDRRTPLNKHTEEIYAYLTEYITREALLKLYK